MKPVLVNKPAAGVRLGPVSLTFLVLSLAQATQGLAAGEVAPVTAQEIQPIHSEPIQPDRPATPATTPSRNQDPRLRQAERWVAQGKQELAAKRYPAAIQAYTKAMELSPDSVSAYNGRGIAFRHVHELDKALSDYNEAVRLGPKHGAFYYNRALVYKEKGDLDRCQSDLRTAAQLGYARAQELLADAKGSLPQPASPAPLGERQPAEDSSPTPPKTETDPTADNSWTSTWKVNNDWGMFMLTQQGPKVTGRMVGGWAEGSVSGSASGNVLNANFQREGRTHIDGQLQLTQAPDGRTFSGKWKWAESGVWAASSLTGTRSAPGTLAPEAKGPQLAEVVGTWHGVATTVGTLELHPDGTYTYNGNAGGRYSLTSTGIDFSGSLNAWGGGHATLKRGNLEFHWTNPGGSINWFAFSK